MSIEIILTNSLSGKKEIFKPMDCSAIKMYVCGPTVYDRPHIGNTRSAVVYDILYRLLRYIYDSKSNDNIIKKSNLSSEISVISKLVLEIESHKELYKSNVIYVRNITDIDDKIINAALKRNMQPKEVAFEMEAYYHIDTKALMCLRPTMEPKATDHIQDMIEIIKTLIRNGYAYRAQDEHIFFDIEKYKDYGSLSKRSLNQLIAGARIEINPYKKHPNDFVLWKPVHNNDCGFISPFGWGRPGWHIECTAMSTKYLGTTFDIHGGGVDLIFPHHENEIAQARCSDNNCEFARYWIHNGFLTVNGEKMSKSLQNFKTTYEILSSGIHGSVLRYFYLTSNYHKPLDFNNKAIADANKSMQKFLQAALTVTSIQSVDEKSSIFNSQEEDMIINGIYNDSMKDVLHDFVSKIAEDMNTAEAIAHLHEICHEALLGNVDQAKKVKIFCAFLGLDLNGYAIHERNKKNNSIDPALIQLAENRLIAKKTKDLEKADEIRNTILKAGYKIEDKSDGYRLVKL